MADLTVKVLTQNFASAKTGWTSRSQILANRIIATGADVIYCTELYARQRPRMVSLLSSKYTLSAYHNGRVIFHRTAAFKAIAGSGKAINLPNSKFAVGVKLQSISTGKKINAVCAHLTYQHEYESRRAAETKSLITQVKKLYPANRSIYGGDWNASLKFGARTGDSVGKTFGTYGYRDLYKDVALASRYYEEYNSANQYKLPAPKSGIHLDRIFGGDLKGRAWRMDAYIPSTVSGYGSDHFGVGVTLTFPI